MVHRVKKTRLTVKSSYHDLRIVSRRQDNHGLYELGIEGTDLIYKHDFYPETRYVSVEFLDPHPVSGHITHTEWFYKDELEKPLTVGELVYVPTRYQGRNRAIVRKVNVLQYSDSIDKSVTKRIRTVEPIELY